MSDSKPDQPQIPEGPFKNLIMLTLPWLSLQREILELAKTSIQDVDRRPPTERFTFSEMHAMLMILDPSGSFRNLFGQDFEKKVEAYKELSAKFSSAAVEFIDAQDSALCHLEETLKTSLDTLRKGDRERKSSQDQD